MTAPPPPATSRAAAPRVAVFAGSFDPVTAGHVDLAVRALALADRLVVAVAVNASKQPMFTLEEREALVRGALAGAGAAAVGAPLAAQLVLTAVLVVAGCYGALLLRFKRAVS